MESRIKQLLHGRDLRILSGKVSSQAANDDVKAATSPGPAGCDSRPHILADVQGLKLECDVAQALTCLTPHFRALDTTNLTITVDAGLQQLQRGVSGRDRGNQGETSSSGCAAAWPRRASVSCSREPGMASGAVSMSHGGAEGIAGYQSKTAAQDRGVATSHQPAYGSKGGHMQWDQPAFASVVDMLVAVFAQHAAVVDLDSTVGGASRDCKADLGSVNVGAAPVNTAPSWSFAAQHVEGAGCTLTRSGMLPLLDNSSCLLCIVAVPKTDALLGPSSGITVIGPSWSQPRVANTRIRVYAGRPRSRQTTYAWPSAPLGPQKAKRSASEDDRSRTMQQQRHHHNVHKDAKLSNLTQQVVDVIVNELQA